MGRPIWFWQSIQFFVLGWTWMKRHRWFVLYYQLPCRFDLWVFIKRKRCPGQDNCLLLVVLLVNSPWNLKLSVSSFSWILLIGSMQNQGCAFDFWGLTSYASFESFTPFAVEDIPPCFWLWMTWFQWCHFQRKVFELGLFPASMVFCFILFYFFIFSLSSRRSFTLDSFWLVPQFIDYMKKT